MMQPPMPQAARPAGVGSGLKILFVVLGCFAVAGMAVIGGLYFVAHKVKQVVVEKAAENGVDLSGITAPSKPTRSDKNRFHNPCDLMSKEDAARFLGEPIERTVVQDLSCMYLGPKGLSAKLAQEQASKTFKRAQAPGATVDAMDMTNAMDQALSAMAAEAGKTGVDGEWPLLMLSADPDGKGPMMALSAGKAIFNGIVNASQPNSKQFSAEVPGLGDKAIRMPKIGLHVLKGETVLGVIVGAVPDADAKSIEIARAILPRL